MTVEGKSLLNFESCSYLGLEMHPEVKQGVKDAADRYGALFSASRSYLSSPLYAEAEDLLSHLFGRPTLIAPTTTLGHISALPSLVAEQDALILDRQAHNSIYVASSLVRDYNPNVSSIPHSDLTELGARVEELSSSHERVWYALDGLYSMEADFAPAEALNHLMKRFPKLWLYVDDAHSVSWSGKRGRGYALEALDSATLSRSVVAMSLGKAFGAVGGALTFPNNELLERVFTLGGPMLFSGQVQPPMLGAVVASARLHLAEAVQPLQDRLCSLIELFNRRAAERDLPLTSDSVAPIRCITVGSVDRTYRAIRDLRDGGYLVGLAAFPAVPMDRAGLRVTLTCHHSEADIENLVSAMANALSVARPAAG
ncbi:aminotransferase class I/II-fold pyridoxal phosphate-dependent enzyme [Nocardia neocaledoniensis]|uniref:aminotransferase class I/II-fold pyridoxal phosphate-dependent enzyme n=1 Tax=Nocardia neocaledoniensis TaxID=236511 RepID=UPI0024569106|nr:aminotransferase class I/II-fold pyridoxal phosphate-dependent enzyme [Nocardia neocaledoniensis]